MKTSNNYIVEFDGAPVVRLSFQKGGQADLSTGDAVNAIHYTQVEAEEAAASIGRGAKAVPIAKLIGYYNGDEYGTDGWWEEGDTTEEIAIQAGKIARQSGFDSAPDLVEVETLKLYELSEIQWGDLIIQWRLSRRNGWTSPGVDSEIQSEMQRRNELSD